MKKLFALLLCLSLLLLPGCQLQDLFQLATIVPPTGSEEDYRQWNDFIWKSKWGEECSVEIQRTYEDGSTEKIAVTYDKEKYTITDDAGTRSYAHLIYDRYAEEIDGYYHYGDYFFLTDDANLTFEKYRKSQSTSLKDHMELLLPTELVLGKVGIAGEVECYGNAPKKIENILSAIVNGTGYSQEYCRNSFFVTEYHSNHFFDGESESSKANFPLNRYDYDGNLLCSVEIPDWRTNKITEFDDGSFIVSLEDYTDDGEAELLYFSNNGKLQWHYVYPSNIELSLYHFFLLEDAFYVFGGINTNSYYEMDDLYIAKFSIDGTLLKEVTAGGSKSDVLQHVELSKNGFTLFARTNSSDGNFPVGSKEHDKLFHVEVSTDLDFSELTCPIKKQFTPYPFGYYKGEIIYYDDPMLREKETDRLPEYTDLRAIIPWGNGYVLLRNNGIEGYAFSNPHFSSSGSYRHIIATYYNASGKPIWQTVSEPYLG